MRQLESFSTDGLSSARRVDYWNRITSSAVVKHVTEPVDRQAFCGRMTSLDLGELSLIELNASGSKVTHSRAHVGCSRQAIYLVRLIIAGDVSMTQAGREIRLTDGDFTLCDASQPYHLFFGEASDTLVVRIPRQYLLRYIGCPDDMIAVPLRGNAGLSGLASRHLRDLWAASGDFLTNGASLRMTDLTMQLLASAYSAIPRAKADRSCLVTAHRAQIIRYIERNLSEPDLTAAVIAAGLRITPGYLHHLFSDESETVCRYILRRRLEKCARALRDPLQSSRSITAIAFDWGFNSLPHFCRVFRERYRATPGDYRERTGGEPSE